MPTMSATMEAEQEEQAVDQLQKLDIQEIEILPNLDEVEEIFGYKFKNRGLLEEAFTHSSFPSESGSYERLEYVGDAVLNLLFTKEHYFSYHRQKFLAEEDWRRRPSRGVGLPDRFEPVLRITGPR